MLGLRLGECAWENHCSLPASCTLLGVTTLWPQVYTSPSAVSTTVWRFAAATAVMPLPYKIHRLLSNPIAPAQAQQAASSQALGQANSGEGHATRAI